jgi:hypothetical protein
LAVFASCLRSLPSPKRSNLSIKATETGSLYVVITYLHGLWHRDVPLVPLGLRQTPSIVGVPQRVPYRKRPF